MGLSEYVEPLVPSLRSVIIFFFVVYIPLYLISVTFFRRRIRKTPFALPSLLKLPQRRLVTERRARDAVLRQHFDPSRVPSRVDAVVVGSGLGGIATAALLARSGFHVLVLESGHVAGGGATPLLPDSEAEWEEWRHFGNIEKNSVLRLLVDQITNGLLDWAEVDSAFDSVFLCGAEDTILRRFAVWRGHAAFQEELARHFPAAEGAIASYMRLLDRQQSSLWHTLWAKVLPRPLFSLLARLGVARLSPPFSTGARPLAAVLDELTADAGLRTALTYPSLHAGRAAGEAFAAHAFRRNQALACGGFHPVGGAREVTFLAAPLVEAAGGRVLVGARVERLLADERRVTGVRVRGPPGTKAVDVRAKCVVLGGLAEAGRLLEGPLAAHLPPAPAPAPEGVASLSLQLWLRVGVAEAGLRAQNCYFLAAGDRAQEEAAEWWRLSAADACERAPPCLVLASPSAKDPRWAQRRGDDVSLAVVTFAAPRAWVQQLRIDADTRERFAAALWSRVRRLLPQLEKVALDRADWLVEEPGAGDGPERFTLETQAALRPETGVRSLLVTGAELMVGGLEGELFGAVLCASHVLNRNLMAELVQMKRGVEMKKV